MGIHQRKEESLEVESQRVADEKLTMPTSAQCESCSFRPFDRRQWYIFKNFEILVICDE